MRSPIALMAARFFALAAVLVLASSAAAQSGGDYDGDGDVDGADFWFWSGCMTGPAGSLPDPNCAAFDFDFSRGDGKVDLADLAAFGRAFTGSPCTPGYRYALAWQDLDDVTGCSAYIRTRTPTLCGEPLAQGLTASAASAGVQKHEGTSLVKWAQTGYSRRRLLNSTTILQRGYAEVVAGPDPIGDRYVNYTDDPPGSGTHEYKCYLISSLFGTWRFEYDGLVWDQWTHNGWKNVAGDELQWSGEIWDIENDMVGTATAKCDFTQCQYAFFWTWFEDANIPPGNIYTSDANEWGVERISGTSINVWDKNTLPLLEGGPPMSSARSARLAALAGVIMAPASLAQSVPAGPSPVEVPLSMDRVRQSWAVRSEPEAVAKTREIVGLAQASPARLSAELVMPIEDNTPFLYDEIVGWPVWHVVVTDWMPDPKTPSSTVEPYLRVLDVLIDAEKGCLLEAVTRWPDGVPPIAPEPSARSAEEQLRNAGLEKYVGFPDGPPRVNLLRALEITSKEAGEPDHAKRIVAHYVMQRRMRSDARPVWAITLRGIGPIKPLPPGEPVGALNDIRAIINAETGKCLGSNTVPQPETGPAPANSKAQDDARTR